ncbi:ankyrin repeat domain-containing protein, partial [bacterium]|nr:ankyrin repeat domain-containing protein [bacterium]
DTLVYNNTLYVSSATRGPGIVAGSRTYNTSIHNNLIVTAPSKCVLHVRDTSGGYNFRGNCYWSSGAPLKIMWNGKTYASLAAWCSATDQEKTGNSNVDFEIDPMLVEPGKGGTISDPNKLDRLTSYQLRVDSPVIDEGINLKTAYGIDCGNRDFFNNTVPQGKRQDIGAHEIILEDNLPLHKAVVSNNINKVKEFISAGANVNKKDKYNQAPVDLAIRYGYKEAVELLAVKGAGFSIHLAAFLGNVERLNSCIKNGADVNQKNTDGQLPLHLAARSGHKHVAELLIANGSLIDEEEDTYHFTPLHFASKCGHIDVANLLIVNGSKIDVRDHHDFTPLHWAALCNQRQLVELLLSKGAEVNAKDKDNRTPLYYSYLFGETYSDIIELLVVNGADVNVKCGRYDGTPLHYAAREGHKENVEVLLEHGADVNAKNARGGIALHIAAHEGHKEIVELLLENDADVNIGEKYYNRTAAEFAMGQNHKEIVELLVSKGADISPLHFALYMKDEAKSRSLIEGGADVNKRTPYGTTPLDRAIGGGFIDIVKLLIDRGADVNAKDNWDWTPLHSAVYGHKEVVELLIAKGVDVNARDGGGRTPLWYAKERGHAEIVEFLRKHGAKE